MEDGTTPVCSECAQPTHPTDSVEHPARGVVLVLRRTFKGSMAVAAGLVLAGGVLMAPGVAAAPTTGRVAAWGSNQAGQLGNKSTAGSSVPVPVNTAGVLAGKTITAMDAGDSHTCVVADGKAYCWGDNYNGQLGDGSTANSGVPVPVNTAGVLDGRTVTAISAAKYHTCAVADGKAYCWGYNESGGLGNNSFASSLVPVAVDTSGVLADKTVTAISAGVSHTCVVADGKAYCWGTNGSLQLGRSTPDISTVPVAVDTSGVLAGKTVTEMSAGGNSTCVLAGGRPYCWGHPYAPPWSHDSRDYMSLPFAVGSSGLLAGKTVTAIAAGINHACAVADGKAYCWGHADNGALGDGVRNPFAGSPVAVNTDGPLYGKTVTAITVGGAYSCAVADGKAYCWGFNGSGQLGSGSSSSSSWVPVAVDRSGVLDGRTVTAISAGGSHTAALFGAVPHPPTAVAGVAGDAKVTVSWTAPGDDGGSPVSEYVATAIPGGSTCTTSGTSCVVSGLVNGTPYTFTVTARNAAGVSAPSAPSAPVTPAAPPPSAPVAPPAPQVKPVGPLAQPPLKVTGVVAAVRNGTVNITWKAVAGTTSYKVRITKPGGTTYKAWKTTSKRVFTAKLRKGAKYRFQVVAVGAGGRGPALTIRLKGK